MVRSTAVAAAVLVLLVAPAFPAGGAAAPSASAGVGPGDGVADLTEPSPVQRNTTAVLLFGPQENGAVHTPVPDLSTALSAGHDTTSLAIADRRLRDEYAAADDEARRELLSAALDRVSERADTLDDAERDARRGYGNGTYTAAEAVERLAGLDPIARSLDGTLEFVANRAGNVSAGELRSEARTLRSGLVPHYGPVRERLAATVMNGQPPTPTYVAGTESGVRFGLVEDGVHYHESYKFPESDGQTPSDTSIGAVEERVAELYPWASNESTRTTIDAAGSEAYQVFLEHPYGTLTTYIDMETLDVVKEVQRNDLAELPPGLATESADSGDLTIIVNQTYPGGPLRVQALDTDGNAVNASVRVANEDAGYTGDDGVAWTVGGGDIGGSGFPVVIERGEEQVSISVQPLQPSSGA